jgi:hypothetical protein|tara:strand:+ start:1206 stop:1766 length:561 start_codon:yes stop_codon:yes gene_type:complete
MGRANNSFTSYVGHALEINPERGKTPEQDLWTSVLSKAAHDAIYSSDWFESKQAIEWFKANRSDFKEVCKMAGRNPDYVHLRMQQPLADREGHMEQVKTGQRYYVKDNIGLPRGGKVFHTHYRGSRLNYKPHSPRGVYKKRGRPKKKHLTGNAYYAAKATKEMKKRNLYYQGMGAKGGRPRIYNVV